jgi:S1/P1 Nuclease
MAWVNESYRIAVGTIYGRFPHSGTLPKEYEMAALPIANEQLERAGVRLATVLNKCLK